MKVEKYGIVLRRITEEDIELVRQKRNEIASRMVYQDQITKAQQKKWFASINNFNNFYYLIEYEGKTIGLIHDKNIDWKKKVSEAGMFIWEKEYLHTIIPALASLALLEFGVEVLAGNGTVIRILESNREAIRFNQRIGFKVVDRNPEEQTVILKIDPKIYREKVRKMVLAMSKLNEYPVLRVTVEENVEGEELNKQLVDLFKESLLQEVPSDENGKRLYEYDVLKEPGN